MKTPSKKPHLDTLRLKAVVSMATESGTEFNCDFAQELFHARARTKTELAAFRRALDRWIRDGRV